MSQEEGTPRSRTGIPNPSRSHRSLLPFSRPPSSSWPPPPPFLWVISGVIYFSLPFILLLHLLVIHTYPQVHVPSVILSGVLWAAVAPIALSHDFGLPRRGSSSAVQFGSLDSLHSSSGTSSSSAWALGFISNVPESPDPLAPQYLITYLDEYLWCDPTFGSKIKKIKLSKNK